MLGSHLRLTLDIQTAYTKNKTQNRQTPAKWENLIFGVITLLDSNVCCSTTKTQGTQRNRKYGPFKGKNKSIETVSEKRPNGRYTSKDNCPKCGQRTTGRCGERKLCEKISIKR